MYIFGIDLWLNELIFTTLHNVNCTPWGLVQTLVCNTHLATETLIRVVSLNEPWPVLTLH